MKRAPSITCYKITISLKYSFILSHFLCFLKPIRQSGHINQISFMCKPVNHCRHKHLVLYDFIPSVKSQISSNDCSLFPALNDRWLKSSSPPSLSQLTYPNSSQMTRSYFSNLNCSVLSVFADLASLIWVSRTGTEVNNTVKSCWQAFIPKAVAICVFPVPGFPYRTRFLPV